jgi:hypothetical protein
MFVDIFLVQLRKDIHRILDLPTDRPLIRRVDAFQFAQDSAVENENKYSKYLQNPHTSAKPSNGKTFKYWKKINS